MRYKPLTISKKQAQSWQPTSGDLRPETTCCAKNPKCGMTGMQAVFVSIAMSSNRVQHLVPFVADVQSLRYLCGWFFPPIDKRILKTAWWSRNSQFPFLFTVHPSHCIFFSRLICFHREIMTNHQIEGYPLSRPCLGSRVTPIRGQEETASERHRQCGRAGDEPARSSAVGGSFWPKMGIYQAKNAMMGWVVSKNPKNGLSLINLINPYKIKQLG